MTVEYDSLVGYKATEPHNWLHHRDDRLEQEARHAVWVGHTGDTFWDSWVRAEQGLDTSRCGV